MKTQALKLEPTSVGTIRDSKDVRRLLLAIDLREAGARAEAREGLRGVVWTRTHQHQARERRA